MQREKTNSERRLCRSMLYIPGDSPGMIQNAEVFGADSILLDLEDSIAESAKDSTRKMVRAFLADFDFGKLFVTVRVNSPDTPYFGKDLRDIIPCRPGAVRIPKCGKPADITEASSLMSKIEWENEIPRGSVKIHAMIETALGVENAYLIARASRRISALTLGGQDLTADMFARKTREGRELFYARSRVVVAARAAKVMAFDTVWTDIGDPEGLFAETKEIVDLGFDGKAAIHPSQIEIIHKAFRPDEKDVIRAKRIVEAAEKARNEGKGVISVDGRMVDAPVVARAQRIVGMASLYEYGEGLR